MEKYLKLLSLAAALCGAVACSSGGGGTTGTTAGPGTPGTTGNVAGTSGGTAAGPGTTGGTTGAAAGTTGGNGTTGGVAGTTGGTTGTTSPPTAYPCVDGGNAYQPTNPPTPASCWCNPGVGLADPTDAGAQIVNACPQNGATPDNNIPQPPPAGIEMLPFYDGGGFPQPSPGS